MTGNEELLKQSIEKTNALVTELEKQRVEMAKALEAGKKTDLGFGELSEKYMQLTDEIIPTLVTQQNLEDLKKELARIETALERSEAKQEENGIEKREHHDAMFDYFNNCVSGLTSEKTKEFMNTPWYQHQWKGWLDIHSLTETVATDGGFLVSPQMEAEILKNVVEISPIRGIARVTPINLTNSLKIPRRTAEPSAERDTETGTATETKRTTGMWDIPVHALTAKTTVTNDLLADVPLFESEVQEDISEQFAKRQGRDYTLGNGVLEPRGISFNAGTDSNLYPAIVTSLSSGALDKKDFSLMFTTLKQAYWSAARWVFNQSTLKELMQLEATTGNFIWVPGLTAGLANTILGLPFTIAQDVASITANALAVYLGNFNKGYRIVDRSGMLTQRDPFTTWPQVVFKFRSRDGGQVVIPESIKILKIKA